MAATEHHTADHAEAAGFLLDEKGWVAAGFFIFLALFIKYVWPLLAKMLDGRATEIAAKLKEAESLKEEAQAILAEAERKSAEAERAAKDMVKTAKADAKQMGVNAEKDIQEEIDRKISIANEKIKRAERAAIDNVKSKAVDAAIAAASEAIEKELAKSGAKSEKMVKESLKVISNEV